VYKIYEFGVKVSLVVTQRDHVIVGALELPRSPFDGHTLSAHTPGLKAHRYQTRALLCRSRLPRPPDQRHQRAHRRVEARRHRGIACALKRRNAIEPIIGHAKHYGLMGRNYLLGIQGDAMNATLAAAGHNLCIILRKLRLSWLRFLHLFLRDLRQNTPTSAVT
jgi:transposase, IS5 family